MYIPLIIFFIFVIWYICFRIQHVSTGLFKSKKLKPIAGEDAMHAVRIIGASNCVYIVSRYLSSVKNISEQRFLTVGVNQIITTSMGTTSQARLIENLAPGEERWLGHIDHLKDKKYQVFISFEILWARYVPTPSWYIEKNKESPSITVLRSDKL